MAIDLVHVHPEKKQAVVSVGPVFVFFSRRPPELAVVRWLIRHLREHRQRHSRGFGFIFYAEPTPGNQPRLEGDARRELVEALRSEGIKGTLAVYSGKGFVGAAFRALASGVILAIRAPAPTKVTASLADGLPWLIETLARSGVHAAAGEIAEGVQRLETETR